ncbi:menaquinone biosynthesis family protein [Campylobacter sputorum]|uniref:menaquinone biosynthesis family protein n=1 Tax=Campylobacter sputorum TaxID=206 RepID=UPI001E311E8D|nr:MqnA/MqnD/SBP family protein [Campylobacter sputorum]
MVESYKKGLILKKNISVAHSPDADDIFMYMAIKFGWVTSKTLNFKNIALDIETLNVEAIKGTYDATAISFGLYPKIADDYAMLRCAVSFGDGYGPKLIKKKGISLKKNFKVALSGENTSNALIFRIAYPQAKIIYKNFLDIENAVLNGEVDAGVLIHESILEFDSSLCVERELWDIWNELSGGNLPFPLGCMALRRSMPLVDAIECEKTLTKAVKVAHDNTKTLSSMLMERNMIRVDEIKLEKYLGLYANAESISMNELQLKAANKLFELGFRANFFHKLIDINDYLIPTDYENIRNS